MRKLFSLTLAASAVTACTQMTDYYPDAQTTDIAGRAFFVVERPSLGPGVYLAGPNDPKMGEVLTGRDMTLPQANVAAIEAVTGCKVARETVRNQEATTYAAVTCQ
ncbi:hypothetical protein BXY66_3253 [Shimia isoporae]|uniref:Uncharacterized protein n=1 Tax=Shimia isoporae TaxID=647720 RepID=A0A4R1N742_9RHOB|nr:hypothetical protein [Shimia isoporae]TCL00607.1 hypothetical protein BXY66_3253 [Shimia isoporae]